MEEGFSSSWFGGIAVTTKDQQRMCGFSGLPFDTGIPIRWVFFLKGDVCFNMLPSLLNLFRVEHVLLVFSELAIHSFQVLLWSLLQCGFGRGLLSYMFLVSELAAYFS